MVPSTILKAVNSERRERAKLASVVGISPPWPAVTLCSWCRVSGLHTPLWCHRTKDFILSPQRTRGVVGLANYHMTYTFKQNRGVHPEAKQGSVFPYKVVSPVQAGRTLSFSRKMFQTQGLAGVKDGMRTTAFLNTFFVMSCRKYTYCLLNWIRSNLLI